MIRFIENVKGMAKGAVVLGLLFLIGYITFFYLSNLGPDIGRDAKVGAVAEASFSGKLESARIDFENTSPEGDADADGLTNALEDLHGTDPKNADTDKDGFTDGQEITNGYDPDAPGEARPGVVITVQRIGVSVPMVWSKGEDEKSQLEDLKRGASHFPKTASPGQAGNMIVSGHSSNYIWASGDYNYIFKNLNKLEAGDTVDVRVSQQNGKVLNYQYKVSGKNIMLADDPNIFVQTAEPTLTLSTCWPIGTNYKRLIVMADLAG